MKSFAHSAWIGCSCLFLAQGKSPNAYDMAKAVDVAVDKGVAWLKTQQEKDGSFRYPAVKEALFGEYPLGFTDLSVLALLSCGVQRDDPAIENGVRYILENPSRTTYEAGLSLMALEMKGAPSWERRSLDKMSPEQKKGYKFPRILSDEERTRIQEDSYFLLKSWGTGYWSYSMKSGSDGDISNTQFAVLGLKAASRCGVEISISVFEELMHILLDHQELRGRKVQYPQVIDHPGKDGNYIIDQEAQVRGWAYFYKGYKAENDVTGSRTNIGLACLAICEDEIRRRGDSETMARLRTIEPRLNAAIRDGLAWMDHYFSVEKNPGTEGFERRAAWPVNGFWYYYYMYSLERTGALLPTRWIGRHDWYREGAEAILARQKKDGSWNETHALADTAFALLFLRRATIPSVYTARRDITTQKG